MPHQFAHGVVCLSGGWESPGEGCVWEERIWSPLSEERNTTFNIYKKCVLKFIHIIPPLSLGPHWGVLQWASPLGRIHLHRNVLPYVEIDYFLKVWIFRAPWAGRKEEIGKWVRLGLRMALPGK